MFSTPESINNIADVIHLALAPVFLLTGIAGLLNVMTGRLARIIDRARTLTGNQYDIITAAAGVEGLDLQLQKLERRRHFTSIAITACTIAALLVCTLIMILFIEVMFTAPLTWLIATLFACATMALVVGLAFFLREVHLASQSIRITIANKE